MEKKQIQEYKDDIIKAYQRCYNKTQAFIIAKTPKDVKLELLQDVDFMRELDCIISLARCDDIDRYEAVIRTFMADKSNLSKNANGLLNALKAKNDLLYSQMNLNNEDERCMNVIFQPLSKEEFEKFETVEVQEGDGTLNLQEEDEESFEAIQKKKIKKELEKKDANI